MDEFRLNGKFPRWVVISYVCWFFLGVLNIIFWLFIDENVNISINDFYIFTIVVNIFHFLFPLCGLYFIIQANVYNKYYYLINAEGIYNNQLNLLKKNIKWNSELYYMVTNIFFDLYLTKKMLPLEDKMINKNNIKYGYISIKTKKALKLKIDNKGWICISTKYLKNNIQINNIVDMINISRGIK
jgi:hypothetical protein